MNMKRKLCLGMAAALALSAGAMAEPADLQTQLDEANARIEALEAEVEKYRPFYESQIVAEYGEDGVIMLDNAKAQYDEAAAMYAQYGISVDAYAADIKESIVQSLVQQAVLDEKAAELGLDVVSEEAMADLTEKAAADLETYVGYYTSYFAQEGASDEENRQATIDGLAQAGISQDTLLSDRVENYVSEQLHTYITKDVAVTDEDIQNEYQEMIDDDKQNYDGNDVAYNTARSSGEVIAWNPEGYRAVKHVLVKFTDDQAAQYSDLESALTSLNDELAALDAPEATEAPEEEPAEVSEEAEAAESEETEETEAPRSREEIESDIGAIGVSIEALYAELMPKAQEVVDAFNAGTGIDELIEKYGEDPGMTREPASVNGYAVAKDSTYWDPAFTDGAMSIAEVGQISEPVRGKNGIHIIYYLADIPAGEVPFEDIKEGVEAQALEDKVSDTFNDQVSAWVEEASPVYHLDRF